MANSLLRLAIRQVSAAPVLTGSILLGLAPASHALTLGDISVRSALGQRLDATVPVRLGAGETLASTCVAPGAQGSDLRQVPGARVTAPNAAREGVYELRVTSDTALYEPMYELDLKVQCPGAPILVRQYVLMLDLPAAVAAGVAEAAAPVVAPVPASTGATTLTTAAPPPSARPRPGTGRPTGKIEAGSRYRVTEGDTLSGLAARVQGRQVSLEAMADAIQAANPEAFIRNDANLIKLGSEITIPVTTAAVLPATVPGPMAPPADVPAPQVAVPQVLAPQVPAPVAAPAAEAALAVPTPAPTPAPAPVRVRPPRAATPAPAEATGPATDEANPAVAAGAGIVFGLLVSTLLWFRGRLPVRKRPAPAVARPVDKSSAPGPTALAAAPVPLVTRETEPGFSVSFTPANEDTLAMEFADDPEPEYAPPPAKAPPIAASPPPPPGEDITSELEGLFDGTDTTIQKSLDAEKMMAARALHPEADTVDQPGPNLEPTAQSPAVDLRTLAASATRDQQQAQTLLEALTLLERDYEEELTASQVLDMSAVRDALDNGLDDGPDYGLDEPTQFSEASLREASARNKSR